MYENMNMDYDIKLIEEVKKYPELYDSSHRNKEVKAALWKDIAFKMRKQTDEYSVKVVKLRWKSLRDSYVKEIKYKMAVSTGHIVKPRKNWRYSNIMSFLAPHLAISFPLPLNKFTDESMDTKEDLGEQYLNQSNVEDTTGHFLGALLDFSKHNDNETNESDEKEPPVLKREDLAEEECSSPRSDGDGGDIDAFFKGIAETVKKMNVINQVFVQRNIVNMILDFKLREAQEKYAIQQKVADDND